MVLCLSDPHAQAIRTAAVASMERPLGECCHHMRYMASRYCGEEKSQLLRLLPLITRSHFPT
jgi:hypothetical protein